MAMSRALIAECDDLLNETLFINLAHAQVKIAAWVEDYNRERPGSSLGYTTLTAFTTELNKQRPTALRPTGAANQPLALIAPVQKTTALFKSELRESWGHVTYQYLGINIVNNLQLNYQIV